MGIIVKNANLPSPPPSQRASFFGGVFPIFWGSIYPKKNSPEKSCFLGESDLNKKGMVSTVVSTQRSRPATSSQYQTRFYLIDQIDIFFVANQQGTRGLRNLMLEPSWWSQVVRRCIISITNVVAAPIQHPQATVINSIMPATHGLQIMSQIAKIHSPDPLWPLRALPTADQR